MAVIPIGGSLVIMQGFSRQKAIARDPAKKSRMFAFRRYVVPSETRESLQARISLAQAAISARGRSFEEVVANIVSSCSGKDYGGKAKANSLKSARHAAASANVTRMQAKLSRV